MSYLKQKVFMNKLSNHLSQFINQIIFPQQSWTRFAEPIQFENCELQLCFLTLTPNQQQTNDQSYGTQLISAERASATNLPRLNKQEASILQYFGIQRALTLHPSQNKELQSILRITNSNILPREQYLKMLKTLFMMAMKKAGLPDSFPILVFSGPPYQTSEVISQVHISGFCAGHHFSGVLNANGMRTSSGQSSLLPLTDHQYQKSHYLNNFDEQTSMLKNTKQKNSTETSGFVVVPLISRYYEQTSKDLYGKNMVMNDINVMNEESVSSIQQNNNVINQVTLKEITKILKEKRSKQKLVQMPYLDTDYYNNIYLNNSFIQQQGQKTQNMSHTMSRYIRNFPSLLYGPLQVVSQSLKADLTSLWNVFQHLPRIAKQRGTAVESICFHALSDIQISNQEIILINKQINQKLNNRAYQSSLMGTESNKPIALQFKYDCLKNYFEKRRLDRIYLALLTDMYKNFQQQHFCCPNQSNLKQLLFSVHFGTAAIGSFEENCIDINEAMVWAFNAAFDLNNYAPCQTTNKFETFVSVLKNNQLNSKGSYSKQQYQDQLNFIISNNQQFEQFTNIKCQDIIFDQVKQLGLFKKQNNQKLQDYYQYIQLKKNRPCPSGCILCRLGDVCSALPQNDSYKFIEEFFNQFKELNQQQNLTTSQSFDALRHSCVYQKIVSLQQAFEAQKQVQSDQNNFKPYLTSTYDQVATIYNVYRENKDGFRCFLNSRISQVLIYYITEYKLQQQNDEQLQQFTAGFINFLLLQKLGRSECIKFTCQLKEHDQRWIDEACVQVPTENLVYPYDNNFIVPFVVYIVKFLTSDQKIPDYNQLKSKTKQSIIENYEQSIISYYNFLQEGVDSRYILFIVYYSKMINLFTEYSEILLEYKSQQQIAQYLNDDEILEDTKRNPQIQLDDLPQLPIVTSPIIEFEQIYNEPHYINCENSINYTNLNKSIEVFKNYELTISGYYILMHHLKLEFNEARSISQSMTLLQGSDRETLYEMLKSQLKPIAWEVVLNSISPDKLNNLPHRFYAQFLNFQLQNDLFIPCFQHLISASVVETIPFRDFKE